MRYQNDIAWQPRPLRCLKSKCTNTCSNSSRLGHSLVAPTKGNLFRMDFGIWAFLVRMAIALLGQHANLCHRGFRPILLSTDPTGFTCTRILPTTDPNHWAQWHNFQIHVVSGYEYMTCTKFSTELPIIIRRRSAAVLKYRYSCTTTPCISGYRSNS